MRRWGLPSSSSWTAAFPGREGREDLRGPPRRADAGGHPPVAGGGAHRPPPHPPLDPARGAGEGLPHPGREQPQPHGDPGRSPPPPPRPPPPGAGGEPAPPP